MFISSTLLVQLQEVLNPAAVAGHPGVDAGVSSGARADAPWRHSSLDPCTVLLANIGSATVTLWNIKNSCHTQHLYYLLVLQTYFTWSPYLTYTASWFSFLVQTNMAAENACTWNTAPSVGAFSVSNVVHLCFHQRVWGRSGCFINKNQKNITIYQMTSNV